MKCIERRTLKERVQSASCVVYKLYRCGSEKWSDCALCACLVRSAVYVCFFCVCMCVKWGFGALGQGKGFNWYARSRASYALTAVCIVYMCARIVNIPVY